MLGFLDNLIGTALRLIQCGSQPNQALKINLAASSTTASSIADNHSPHRK
jgi:hypothetical protein